MGSETKIATGCSAEIPCQFNQKGGPTICAKWDSSEIYAFEGCRVFASAAKHLFVIPSPPGHNLKKLSTARLGAESPATLIGLLGDFDLAEDYAQETFAVALDKWPISCVREFPRAWIVQTARHKEILA